MSSIQVNGTRIYYEKRGRGPAVLLVSGPPARRGIGQRSLTSSPTPTRSSPTIAGATPAAPGRRAGRRPRRASRPTPPPCCADSTWYRRSCSAPAPPRASSPVCAFATRTCYAVRSSTNRHSRPAYPTSALSTRRARRGWRKEWPGAARALLWSCSCAARRAMRLTRRSIRSCANGCWQRRGPVRHRDGSLPRLRAHTRPARSDTSAPRGHSGRRQPRQRGRRPMEIPGSAMARRPPPKHCHRTARRAYGLPRPVRALRQSTTAGTGQAHLIRRGGAHADQTPTKRRTGPGSAQLRRWRPTASGAVSAEGLDITAGRMRSELDDLRADDRKVGWGRASEYSAIRNRDGTVRSHFP